MYRQLYSTRETPQLEAVPGLAQVENSAGGFVFALDDWKRLERFLILGSDAPTYYTTARKLTRENAACVVRCLDADYIRAIDTIRAVSVAGRAPRNDAALFALALAASYSDVYARRRAFDTLPDVARTGEHLFQFIEIAEGLRGHGRAFNRALKRWYLGKEPRALAYQVLKYRNRHNWTHRDVLRLAKPKTDDATINAALRWVAKGETPGGYDELTQIVAYELAKTADEAALLDLIRAHRLTHEMIPTEALGRSDVWRALLADMPMTAMIRNLGRMTANGALVPLGREVDIVISRLQDADRLRKARVHPLAVLVALNTYRQGKGIKGGLTWEPIPAVVDALDAAFYTAFGAVEPTGKRIMLALDVSGSMGGPELSGMTGITPRVGSAAMAMVTLAAEGSAHVVGFTAKNRQSWNGWSNREAALTPLDISPRRRLDDVVRSISDLPFGGTDCALPMLHTLERGLSIDAFVIYTDNETWAGNPHPFQALRQYRERTGIPAKLIVVGMTSTGFTIADPNDAGMMDVVGFDTAAPNVMGSFISD